jgi:hypothetical protein
MASSLKNVTAFVPAPPLYFNDDDEKTIKAVTASVHSLSHPSQHLKSSVESFIHSNVRSTIDVEDDHSTTKGEDRTPSSPSTRTFSTLDPTSPSFKHFTPPTSPYPWKRIPCTPSSATTASTAAMTPHSTTSYASSYLSTPPSPYAKNKSYAATHDMAPPTCQPYHNNNNKCNRNIVSEGNLNIGYTVVSASPTHGFPFKMTKKKSKNVPPPIQSTNKKKNTISVNPNIITGSPQSDDSAIRKQRVKTELCMHYVQNKTCPFGDSCTYAHGEDELQIKTLADLQRNCLIDDVENYRTKPCFTFVAIGSWYVVFKKLRTVTSASVETIMSSQN